MDSPTLRTERLVLLPLGPADLDEVAALYADVEVMRHVTGGVRTRQQTAEDLATAAECWRTRGWGPWAIRDAESGGLVGEGGLQLVDDRGGDTVDFGYTLGRRHWGRGLATEAARAIIDDLWSRYDGPYLPAVVSIDNPASAAVLAKLGFERVGTEHHDGELHQVWRLTRPAGT